MEQTAPKFIQIIFGNASEGHDLYGLDEEGRVWWYQASANAWCLMPNRRGEDWE